jgi:hypothetical protein
MSKNPIEISITQAVALASETDRKRSARGRFWNPGNLILKLHRNERGVLTLTSVFALFLFTILLIMIVNVATHLDDKINRQNAADASAYSGGVILARGMNTISYTNHLLTDVFAITAFLREGRNRQAESLTPEILDEWEKTGRRFGMAEFQKFKDLGEAIVEKSAAQPVGKDRRLVNAFGSLTAAAADFALPVFEYILAGEDSPEGNVSANPQGGLIPQFQRVVILTIPALAQYITYETARRHGLTNHRLNNIPPPPPWSPPPRGRVRVGTENQETDRMPPPTSSEPRLRPPQSGVLWRMSVLPVGFPDETHPLYRTLPAVDPSPLAADFSALSNGADYFQLAFFQRQELAKHYLELWTRDKLAFFDERAQMSRFSHLWRIFSCAELDRLLNEEYPETNLPMMVRLPDLGTDWNTLEAAGQENVNRNLERDFQFLGVVYRDYRRETGPRLFKNLLAKEADAVTFAQITIFIPKARRYLSAGGGGSQRVRLGGTFGYDSGIELPPPPASGPVDPDDERWPRQNWPAHWDLLNQNWTVKLVPATAPAIPEILETPPEDGVRMPNLGGAQIEHLGRVNTH